MSRHRTLAVALGCTALALLPSAHAAEPTPDAYLPCSKQATEGDTAAAKGAFQAGQAAFNEADYQRAITYWEDAYRRDCNAHALLLNLARAYELDGQKRHAVLALETFNERSPKSPQRDQNEKRIEKLKEAIQEEEASPPPETEPAMPEEATDAPPPEQQPAAEPEGNVEYQRTWWHWGSLAAAGVGAVFLGIGIPTVVSGADERSQWVQIFDPQGTGNTKSQFIVEQYNNDLNAAQAAVNQQYPAGQAPDLTTQEGRDQISKDANAANAKVTTGAVLAIVGGVSVIGGTIGFFALPYKRVERSTAVVPIIGPTMAGLSISGTF